MDVFKYLVLTPQNLVENRPNFYTKVIKKVLTILCLSVVYFFAGAESAHAQQTGKIIGKITDKETIEVVPFVNVKIFSGGAI